MTRFDVLSVPPFALSYSFHSFAQQTLLSLEPWIRQHLREAKICHDDCAAHKPSSGLSKHQGLQLGSLGALHSQGSSLVSCPLPKNGVELLAHCSSLTSFLVPNKSIDATRVTIKLLPLPTSLA